MPTIPPVISRTPSTHTVDSSPHTRALTQPFLTQSLQQGQNGPAVLKACRALTEQGSPTRGESLHSALSRGRDFQQPVIHDDDSASKTQRATLLQEVSHSARATGWEGFTDKIGSQGVLESRTAMATPPKGQHDELLALLNDDHSPAAFELAAHLCNLPLRALIETHPGFEAGLSTMLSVQLFPGVDETALDSLLTSLKGGVSSRSINQLICTVALVTQEAQKTGVNFKTALKNIRLSAPLPGLLMSVNDLFNRYRTQPHELHDVTAITTPSVFASLEGDPLLDEYYDAGATALLGFYRVLIEHQSGAPLPISIIESTEPVESMDWTTVDSPWPTAALHGEQIVTAHRMNIEPAPATEPALPSSDPAHSLAQQIFASLCADFENTLPISEERKNAIIQVLCNSANREDALAMASKLCELPMPQFRALGLSSHDLAAQLFNKIITRRPWKSITPSTLLRYSDNFSVYQWLACIKVTLHYNVDTGERRSSKTIGKSKNLLYFNLNKASALLSAKGVFDKLLATSDPAEDDVKKRHSELVALSNKTVFDTVYYRATLKKTIAEALVDAFKEFSIQSKSPTTPHFDPRSLPSLSP